MHPLRQLANEWWAAASRPPPKFFRGFQSLRSLQILKIFDCGA